MNVYPSLRYRDARAAIDWLERAFGFEPVQVHDGQDGAVAHADMRAGDGMIMLGTQPEDGGRFGDRVGLGWTYVATPDVEALFERARAAAAEITMELTDQDYGSRDFSCRDPEGNQWSFGTYEP